MVMGRNVQLTRVFVFCAGFYHSLPVVEGARDKAFPVLISFLIIYCRDIFFFIIKAVNNEAVQSAL